MLSDKHLPAVNITYTYDPLHRLTCADYSTGESFAYVYDAVGNRTVLTETIPANGTRTTQYEYDAANRLTNVNGVAYTWDANGNLLSDGSRTFQYDYANRLVQVVSGTLTTEFVYNGDSHCVAKTVNGSETRYTLDPAMGLVQVLAEVTGGEATRYVYGTAVVLHNVDPRNQILMANRRMWKLSWGRCSIGSPSRLLRPGRRLHQSESSRLECGFG